MSWRKRSISVLLVTKLWPVVLVWFCALAIPATHASAQTNKREIVRQAAQSYYSLRRLGLLEFKAEVRPNWELLATKFKGSPEALKMLNGLRFSLSLKPDGSVKLEHGSDGPIPSDQQENVKQLSAGMDEALSGFFATWNLFMLTSALPAVGSEYQLQDLNGNYLLTYKDGDADVSTTMTRELLIMEMKVSSSSFKASIKPEFTKTQKGYVLGSYQASYEPTSGPGNSKLSVQLDYQEVNGLQLPRKLNLDAIYEGNAMQLELQFSQYQLKLADSGVSGRSN